MLGRPVPKGSKTRTRYGVRDDNPNVKPWEARIAAAGHDALDGGELLDGPLSVMVDFYFSRPTGHFGTGRNAGQVRAGAPVHMVTKPDLDKLVRALDALSGIVWRDDNQVVALVAAKHYGTPQRLEVSIYRGTATGEGTR